MSQDLEHRLTEWAVWFHQNKPRIPPENLKKRIEFLELALDGCFECVAIATKDIQQMENRPKSARLWLPSGVQASGDFRRFG